jgi:hypothetical protein
MDTKGSQKKSGLFHVGAICPGSVFRKPVLPIIGMRSVRSDPVLDLAPW